MGMGFAPTRLRQESPPSLLHKTTLTTDFTYRTPKTTRHADVANLDLCGRVCWPQLDLLSSNRQDKHKHTINHVT